MCSSASAVVSVSRLSARPSFLRRGVVVRASANDGAKGGKSGGMDGVPRPADELARKRDNFLIRAVAADAQGAQPSGEDSSAKKDIASLLLAAWDRFVRPLRDFGFGRKSVWEGGVGLFILGGIGASCFRLWSAARCHCACEVSFSCSVYFSLIFTHAGLLGLLISWIRGIDLRRAPTYRAIFEFPLACGIQIGTPVRVRGVGIGSVLAVKPSMERVDVMVRLRPVHLRERSLHYSLLSG